MFKPYQAIMVLGMYDNGGRFDIRGIFIKEMVKGLNKGQYQVEVNTIKVHFPKNQIMDYETYMKLYNEDQSKLPELAVKKLNFLEGDHKYSGDIN